MRNLIKKSLAFLLVAALALTCFVGTLTVSAENPTATITITADAVEAGATEIPVTLTVESEVGINEALIKVSSDLGVIAEEADVTLVSADGIGTGKIEYAEGTTDFGSFFLSAVSPDGQAETVMGEITKATIKVVFTNEAGIAAKETPYTVNVEIPEGKVIAASKDEVAIDLVCNGLEIVVAEAPVEPAEPVLDETLVFSSVKITVTSTVNIRYRIKKSDYTAKYSNFEVVAYGKEYSFDNANLYNEADIPETIVPLTQAGSSTNTYLFEGISMCSLGLDINAYIKAYDAEGNYVAYSPVTTTSPESALKSDLAVSTTDTGKATIIELLNMAAAAQVQFAANKAGTDLAQAVADGKLVNKDVPASIVTDLPNFNIVDNTVNWADSIDAAFSSAHKITTTVTITASPNIRLYFGGKDTIDTSKLKVDFTYYDPDPNVKKTVTKTIDGSTAEGAAAIGVSGKRLTFNIPGFEFHNSNQTVTATVSYDVNGDGILEEVANVNYSIETYLASQLDTSSTASDAAKGLAAAIAKFGLAFRMNKGIA